MSAVPPVDELLIERVLRAVECVPPGQVATYGDIAALVGTGPRQVGRIMATDGSPVPWWRVVNARGTLGPWRRALGHWADEGIGLNPRGDGCALAAHRVDPGRLAAAYARAVSDLPPQ
ncbi:cysteine methyltransferase [Propionibacterium australiense]|uniref:Cysteine methyltransferase n=1 Tax=Propionibacterium australiense TaxID=119981 RepID=A0A8B3FTQ1_9ACTN|nr:cysteine methyltransferase [Propionibacterium australiense]RLP12490.1 cysteine methyltransferase [Propionibacterium australiense]